MGLIKTKGIVTKVVNYSDSDKILTVITADLGKIQVFCKGVKKNKSSVHASTEFLAFSEFVLYDGTQDMYHLSSADIIEVFYNLRIDIEKLTYATTMAQMMNDVCQEGETCYKKLQLFLNTLYVISETEKDLDFSFSVFRIRLLALLGFVPRLASCTGCGCSSTQCAPNDSNEMRSGEQCTPNDSKDTRSGAQCTTNDSKEMRSGAQCAPKDSKEMRSGAQCAPNDSKDMCSGAQCAPYTNLYFSIKDNRRQM